MLLALYSDRENQFQYKWFNNETDFNSSFAFHLCISSGFKWRQKWKLHLLRKLYKQLMICKRQKVYEFVKIELRTYNQVDHESLYNP